MVGDSVAPIEELDQGLETEANEKAKVSSNDAELFFQPKSLNKLSDGACLLCHMDVDENKVIGHLKEIFGKTVHANLSLFV